MNGDRQPLLFPKPHLCEGAHEGTGHTVLPVLRPGSYCRRVLCCCNIARRHRPRGIHCCHCRRLRLRGCCWHERLRRRRERAAAVVVELLLVGVLVRWQLPPRRRCKGRGRLLLVLLRRKQELLHVWRWCKAWQRLLQVVLLWRRLLLRVRRRRKAWLLLLLLLLSVRRRRKAWLLLLLLPIWRRRISKRRLHQRALLVLVVLRGVHATRHLWLQPFGCQLSQHCCLVMQVLPQLELACRTGWGCGGRAGWRREAGRQAGRAMVQRRPAHADELRARCMCIMQSSHTPTRISQQAAPRLAVCKVAAVAKVAGAAVEPVAAQDLESRRGGGHWSVMPRSEAETDCCAHS